jgi:MFS family permease
LSFEATIVGLGFIGVGTAALLVASFAGAQKSALESFEVTPDEIYAVISGIWTSSFALGNFIGPTLGGFLMESLGFAKTTTVFQVQNLNWAQRNVVSDVLKYIREDTTSRWAYRASDSRFLLTRALFKGHSNK